MKVFLDITNVVGSVKKLNKFKYTDKEPTEMKNEVIQQINYTMMALNNKEVKELKQFIQFCKKEKFEELEFKTTTRALTIKGNNLNKDHECEMQFELHNEASKETCKYSVDYLQTILKSFKLAEIKQFNWGYKTDGVLKLEINGEIIILAPRFDCE